jgi:hypothetical protein
MFTPGSKYFLGLTGLSLAVAVLYLFLVNPTDLGAVALFGLSASGATIAGFSLFTRDSDAYTAEEAVAAGTASPAASIWPMIFALGAALVLLGLVTNPIVFVLGVAVLVGGCVEWAAQDWAEGASFDGAYNQMVKSRVLGGLEYPGLAAVGLGVIAFLFSRVMLATSKTQAPVIFIIVSTIVLIIGMLVGFKPAVLGKKIVAIGALGALLLAGAGIASALAGERHELAVAAEEDHYSAEHRECGEEESKHYDHLANNTVSLRSSVSATIFVEGGKLYAEEIGLKTKLDTLTVRRANATTFLFRNLDEEARRLVVNLGSAKVAETGVVEKVGTCTQLTDKNQEQILTLSIPKPATAEEPYSFTVPGIEGQIKLVVP